MTKSNILATPLKIVAQYAMDLYLQTYRVSTDFVENSDFEFHCAAAAASFYQQLYEKEYARMRQDGQKEEVISFSNDFLSSQVCDVKFEHGKRFATLKEDVFSFAYDQSNVGVQNVFCFNPKPEYELERSDVDELWQLKYLPITSRIFWALNGSEIEIIKKGDCNVQQIKVLYVPEINSNNPEALLPDGIVKPVIDSVVATMRDLGQGKVVKKTMDLNDNKSVETEINKTAAT